MTLSTRNAPVMASGRGAGARARSRLLRAPRPPALPGDPVWLEFDDRVSSSDLRVDAANEDDEQGGGEAHDRGRDQHAHRRQRHDGMPTAQQVGEIDGLLHIAARIDQHADDQPDHAGRQQRDLHRHCID